MEQMKKLRRMLVNEIEEVARKDDLSAGDLEAVYKLTDTVKNIDKIEMLGGSSEKRYSYRGKQKMADKFGTLLDDCTGTERAIICDCIDRLNAI